MKLHEYEGQKVRLITTIGNIFEGYVSDFIEAEDNEPEKESLIIGDYEIFEDEIKSIELLD